MNLFLSKGTRDAIKHFETELPHALLLTGPEGIGLHVIALHLAGKQLSGEITPTDSKGEIDMSTSGIIRITQIRDLASHAVNASNTERVFIFDNADHMNHQAQNAFLKLLEEPAPHVHFILLSHHDERLLPTTLSRIQLQRITPISHAQSSELLDLSHVTDDTMRTQLLFLAEGLPAELTRLVQDKDDFTNRVTLITDARRLLQGVLIEKLKVIHAYSGDRAHTLELLGFAERILRHTLTQNPSDELVERADLIARTYDRIAANGYIRIQLATLVI